VPTKAKSSIQQVKAVLFRPEFAQRELAHLKPLNLRKALIAQEKRSNQNLPDSNKLAASYVNRFPRKYLRKQVPIARISRTQTQRQGRAIAIVLAARRKV